MYINIDTTYIYIHEQRNNKIEEEKNSRHTERFLFE